LAVEILRIDIRPISAGSLALPMPTRYYFKTWSVVRELQWRHLG